jgi:hypothetical protein
MASSTVTTKDGTEIYYKDWRGSESAVFGSQRSHGSCRSVRRDSVRRWFYREAANLLVSGVPGLKWPEAQQRQPMRMALAGHQFPRAFAVPFGTSAAHEAPMVQEELQ